MQKQVFTPFQLAVSRAVAWWNKTLNNPKFDNGDSTVSGALVSSMAKMLSMSSPPKDESFVSFSRYLYEGIINKIDTKTNEVILSVDYGPEGLLREAAEYSSLPTTSFPYKTVMWIRKDEVMYRYGYGAPIKFLYYTKDVIEKKIEDAKRYMVEYSDNADYYKEKILEYEDMKNTLNNEGYYLVPESEI